MVNDHSRLISLSLIVPSSSTYCEKRFTNSGDLQIHVRIHTVRFVVVSRRSQCSFVVVLLLGRETVCVSVVSEELSYDR